MLEVHPNLYVNSEAHLRRTSDVLRKYRHEQMHRGEFDNFLNSKEGKQYFEGVLPTSNPNEHKIQISRTSKQSKMVNTNSYHNS